MLEVDVLETSQPSYCFGQGRVRGEERLKAKDGEVRQSRDRAETLEQLPESFSD